jgi:hypothetical protein
MKAAVSMASSEAGLPSNIGTTGSGRSTRGDLCGSRVETEAAGAERDDVEEPAGHHQVLVEMIMLF